MEKFVQAIQAGSTVSWDQMRSYLHKWHGYPSTAGGLRGWVRSHYPDLDHA